MQSLHLASFLHHRPSFSAKLNGRFDPYIVSSIPVQQSYIRPRLRAVNIGNEVELQEEASSSTYDVEQSVRTLKNAAKSKQVPASEVFAAIRTLEKAKLDPSNFLQTIGGTESPGRTWMLVFTASAQVVKKALRGDEGGGMYFPVTAVQQFDAEAKTIENGVYLGPVGCLKFKGRFSWNKRLLAFVFDTVSIKIGPLQPFKFNFGNKEDINRIPGKSDPFFIWFYADDEIIVAKGRGGGLAMWVRCSRVAS